MSEEERKGSGPPPEEPAEGELRAVHPAPPPPFPTRPQARPKAEEEPKDEPSKRSRRSLIVALVLGLLAAARLFERLVGTGNRAR